MYKIRHSLSLLVAFLVPVTTVFPGDMPLTNFDGFVTRCLEDFQVPGISIAIVKDDSIRFIGSYGVREIGKNDAVDSQTLFAIGSISKSTVSMSLAMLHEEKKLNWDDPVIKYLPGFRMYDSYVTEQMTIRDLLTHRSGLPGVSGGTIWYASDYTRSEVIERIRYLEPATSFRSRYAYQNIMYLVAGEIIPTVAGRTWDDFIRERIFTPLGMDRTVSRMEDMLHTENVATPHAVINGKLFPIAHRDYDNLGPAASIYSNVEDMARYVRLLLNQGEYAGQRLYSEESASEMWSSQTVIPFSPYGEDFKPMEPHFFTYGFGWFLRDYQGHYLVTHSGGVDGFRALVTMIPEKKLGIIVLTNQDEYRIYNVITYTILDKLLDLPYHDWRAVYVKARQSSLKSQNEKQKKIEAARRKKTKPSLPLSDYAGDYNDPMYGKISVDLTGGKLVLRFSHTPSFTGELEHWHYDTFRIHWDDPMVPDGFVTFPLDSQSKITGMNLDQPDLLDVDFRELHITRIAK